MFRHNKTKREIIILPPSTIKIKLKTHSNSSATGNYYYIGNKKGGKSKEYW